jgi:aminoglycoside phosphotransferase
VRLAFDPGVPHRDAVLDGRALLGVPAARVHAKYRVGESLRVVHRTADACFSARTFPPGTSGAAYERALAAADDSPPATHDSSPAATDDSSPAVVHRPDLDAVVWRFPLDRRLSALPLVARRSAALDRLAGHRDVTPRVVAYCAERSATAECVDASGRVVAFAKVHAGDGAVRERRRLERVAAEVGAHPHLRVPRVVGAADGALAVEPIRGWRLDGAPAFERLGAALATLHERSSVPERRFARLDPDRLATAAAVIARARPDVAAAAEALLGWLLDRRDDAAGPPVCLHGDPSLRNAILDGGRVALIDYEDAAAGPAAADLGRVLAAVPAAADALTRGYAAVLPPPPPAAVRWHTAASVLARAALPAVTRVRPRELARLGPLLEAARG